MSAPQLPPELRAKILGEVTAAPSPTRQAWQLRTIAAALGGVVAAVALFFAIGGVSLGRRPTAYLTTLGVAWVVLLLAMAPWALARGASSVGRPKTRLFLLSLLTPLLVLVVFALGALVWPATRALDDGRSDLRCFTFAVLLSAFPYAAFLWMKRRVVLVHPTAEAAAAGMFAGSLGALLITLRCECSQVLHLLLGHVLPVVLLGGLSALLAGRWLARGRLSA